MPDQIYIGKFAKGYTTNPLPFNIDNDAFPYLMDFYVWRERVKRKRGTIFLGQLERQLQSAATATNWKVGPIGTLDGSGNFSGNLISIFSLEPTATITPESITFSDGTNTYIESVIPNGILIGSPNGSGTINYSTGSITITGGAASGTLIGTFAYFPGLPVMGLRDFIISTASSLFPALLAFDTTYAYQFNETTSNFYTVNYYSATNNPVYWSGENYQQFWSTYYSNAAWVTNNKPGLHYLSGTYSSGSGTTTITFNFKNGVSNFTTLVVGDVLWFNQWNAMGVTLNGITGTVSNISGAASGNYVVTFTANQTVSGTGIVQMLTNSLPGQDGLRFYLGDPTNGTGLPITTTKGWVNFAPPLTATSVTIDNFNSGNAPFYLVGALAIVAFKDRLLFFSPWIQVAGSPAINLADTVIWSWNGTPYYTTSDSNSPPTPVLTPLAETANVAAYYVDQTGLGGYLAAGTSQPITTVTTNEDVILVGFAAKQARLVYTGNDLSPFLFFNINSELGSSATFSGISLDRGGISIGRRGIIETTQQSAQRIDLEIPDSVFQIQASNNGTQRINAVRDFYKEWIYFTYTPNNSDWVYPTQTLLWNYRDNTWALLKENYTTQGHYRRTSSFTWATCPFKTWAQWQEAWNSGITTSEFPNVVGGNPQGYVLIKGQGTGESVSGSIIALTNIFNITEITSNNHCVNQGDYLYVQGAIGLDTATITNISQSSPAVIAAVNNFSAGNTIFITNVNGMTQINGNPYVVLSATGTTITIQVDSTDFDTYSSGGTVSNYFNNQIGRVTQVVDSNNFIIDLPFPSGIYLGLGQYSRLSQPLLQTKQFPFYWQEGRQVRLGAQKYLMDNTANGQVTVSIYLSQDPNSAWNDPTNNPFVPEDSLIYTQLLYTCPELQNIGLTAPNINLQMPTAPGQYQIWHRINTSLIGDTFQIGITLSDAQMRNYQYATSEITLHGMVLTTDKGPHLA